MWYSMEYGASKAVRRMSLESASALAPSVVLKTRLHLAVLHQIDDVRAALQDLVDLLAGNAVGVERPLGAARRDDAEAGVRPARASAPTTPALSASRTETNTVPLRGSVLPAPIWLLAKASA